MQKIKALRIGKGLTQGELGELLGVSQAAIAMWEKGARQLKADTLLKLAAIFGCTVDELLANN